MAKLTDPCSVYHIALPGWPESAGYIGIAADPESRWKQHERDAHAKMSPLEVHHQMREHKGKYVKRVIFQGTRQECLDLEFELRFEWNMGWNTRPGGEWDERHWRPSPDWLDTKLYHPDFGIVELSADLPLKAFVIKYNCENPQFPGSTARVLQGNLTTNKTGWRLADPVLAERVRQKCEAPILETKYLTDGSSCIAITKDASITEVGKWMGIIKNNNGPANSIRRVMRGLRKRVDVWQLCTEEEYLANPGPVFGSPE